MGCYPNCDFTAHPPDYELWSPVFRRTAVLSQGAVYSITVQAGTRALSNNIAVFIDYNNDGDFYDTGEKLGQVSLNANQSAVPFPVPSGGLHGFYLRDAWCASGK
ncbi:MAG: hypothetical protein IPP46_06090 [Bacteroidetes bacterium]|nr:hypothetical protein [Bacteroidota bacterium]